MVFKRFKDVISARTLVQSDVVESTQQGRLSGNFAGMDFVAFHEHFTKTVPKAERLSDTECRLAWTREISTCPPEYTFKKKVKDMRTGKLEERTHLLVEASCFSVCRWCYLRAGFVCLASDMAFVRCRCQ